MEGEVPFLIELTKGVILQSLQRQVSTPIDPDSIAYDDIDGFVWEDGVILLDLVFRDHEGLARARIFLRPSISPKRDVRFLVDAKFLGHLPNSRMMARV